MMFPHIFVLKSSNTKKEQKWKNVWIRIALKTRIYRVYSLLEEWEISKHDCFLFSSHHTFYDFKFGVIPAPHFQIHGWRLKRTSSASLGILDHKWVKTREKFIKPTGAPNTKYQKYSNTLYID